MARATTAVCFTLLALVASASAAQSLRAGNVVELLNNHPHFTIISQAIAQDKEIEAGLKDDAKPVTMYAPTDEAFKHFFSDTNSTTDELLALPSEFLQRILNYHIVPTQLPSSEMNPVDILDTKLSTTAANEALDDAHESTLTVYVEAAAHNEHPLILVQGSMSDAFVVHPDLYAGKSIVHGIDNLLLPLFESGAGHTSDEDFTTTKTTSSLSIA